MSHLGGSQTLRPLDHWSVIRSSYFHLLLSRLPAPHCNPTTACSLGGWSGIRAAEPAWITPAACRGLRSSGRMGREGSACSSSRRDISGAGRLRVALGHSLTYMQVVTPRRETSASNSSKSN